jgi:hypothetical protein
VEVQSDRPQAGSVAKGGGNASPGVAGPSVAMIAGWHRGADDCCAGQGAHREVGSEGFAAKRRAVAEQGEPVGQSPGETEPALRRRRKYLGCLGASRCVRAARRESSMRYPGRSRTVPPTGSGRRAYKPQGEVAADAVREVGVTRGTGEPRNNTSLGIVPDEGRRAVTQTAPSPGKGSRRVRRAGAGRGRVHGGGLMVATAMTEASSSRTPVGGRRGAGW